VKEKPGKFTAYVCPQCFLHDSVLLKFQGYTMCRMCWVHDCRRSDKLTLSATIDELRDRGMCAYCGEFAAEIEHVMPRAAGLPTWTVPACWECNHLAMSKAFMTFGEKRDYIHKKIRKKYRKVLRLEEFDRIELAQMGPVMRNQLQSGLEAKSIVLQRLSFKLEER